MCWFAAMGTAMGATASTGTFLGMSSATMAGLSATASLAGLGLSTMAAYNQSKASKAAYEYQAAVANNNATLDEYKARDAIMRGQSAEIAQRMKTAGLKGTQRASLAARGLDLGEGSAADILASTDYMGETDALTIRDNASREAWGYRVRGSNSSADAGMYGARSRAESSGMAAATSLLTGAGKVAGSWYRYRNEANRKYNPGSDNG